MKRKIAILGMILVSVIFVSVENGEKRANAYSYYDTLDALKTEEIKL